MALRRLRRFRARRAPEELDLDGTIDADGAQAADCSICACSRSGAMP
jgi:uncharacterized protein with von Willebrand factor type A (vWA) domain